MSYRKLNETVIAEEFNLIYFFFYHYTFGKSNNVHFLTPLDTLNLA